MTGVFAHWPNRITAIRFVGSLVLFVLFATSGSGATQESWFFPVAFWLFIVTAATRFSRRLARPPRQPDNGLRSYRRPVR